MLCIMKRCLCSAMIPVFTAFLPLRLPARGQVINSIAPGNFSAFTNCGTQPLPVNFYAGFVLAWKTLMQRSCPFSPYRRATYPTYRIVQS